MASADLIQVRQDLVSQAQSMLAQIQTMRETLAQMKVTCTNMGNDWSGAAFQAAEGTFVELDSYSNRHMDVLQEYAQAVIDTHANFSELDTMQASRFRMSH